METSFINLGLHNPHNGSFDADVRTMQSQQFREFSSDDVVMYEHGAVAAAMTIARRSESEMGPNYIDRESTPRGILNDIAASNVMSRVHEVPLSLYEMRTRHECSVLSANSVAQFTRAFNRDTSNAANIRRSTKSIITSIDVASLVAVVTALEGEDEAKTMVTDVLGLHFRDKESGAIEVRASDEPEINWSAVHAPIQQHIHRNDKRDSILRACGFDKLMEKDPDQTLTALTPPTLRAKEQANLLQRARRISPSADAQHPFTIQRARALLGWSALRPQDLITTDHLNLVNRAHLRGATVGVCCTSYRSMWRAWQKHVEQSGPFLRVQWDDQIEHGTSYTSDSLKIPTIWCTDM